MAVFAQEWFAVPPGQVHPITYRPGDECPAGLEDDARALGLLAEDAAPEPDAPARRGRGRGK